MLKLMGPAIAGLTIALVCGRAHAAPIDDAKYLLGRPEATTALQGISTGTRDYIWARDYVLQQLGGVVVPPAPTPTPTPSPVVEPTPAPAPAPVGIKIADQAALNTALANAKGGEVFLLPSGGGYGVTLSGKSYASPVIITSADPAHRAKISWFSLTNVGNLTFLNVEIARNAKDPANPNAENLGKIAGGKGISFDGVYFHGSLDNDARNDMVGPNIGNVDGLRIVNSRFEQLMAGFRLGACNNVTVANNIVTALRSDGFNFAASTNVLIERNSFSNFQRNTTDHPDAIQFWTQGSTKPSANITIRYNIVLPRGGNGMQGIFLADQVGNLPYSNVLIEKNLIVGLNMANGIFPSHVNGLTIRYNTVVSPVDDGNPVWIRVDKATGVSVTGNIADTFNGVSATGNKLTSASGIDLKLLTTANLPNLTAAQLIVPGVGYQPQ